MGAAQVPTNVGMPPKDGTPCIAGACRGGFGRADPGQPRCDWPETSTDLERGVVVTGSRRRRAGRVTSHSDGNRVPGRSWRHQCALRLVTRPRRRRAGRVTNVVTAIAHLVAPAVTMFSFGDWKNTRELPQCHHCIGASLLSWSLGFGKWWPGRVGGLPSSRAATKGA